MQNLFTREVYEDITTIGGHSVVKCYLSLPLSHSLKWYAARMFFFGLALLIAARPDLDNPGCYRDGLWDSIRGICEVISLVFFVYKLVNEVLLIKRLADCIISIYYTYTHI